MEEQKPANSSLERKVSLGGAIVGGFLALIVGVGIGLGWDGFVSNFAPYLGFKSSSSSSVDWSSLNEVYDTLVSNFDGEVDKTAVLDGAKKGIANSVGDVYTSYMTASEASDFNKSLHGQVGAGIGIVLAERDGYVRVIRTLPDNPAREAGVLAGDIIYKIDDEEVWELGSDEIATKLRGEAGTAVKLTVARDGEEISFDLTREEINNVSADIEYRDSTAIVKITRFDTDTGKIVQNFAKEFESKGINKVIIDLRDNGGGYVSAAKDLVSLWVDSEKVLIQKSARLADETTFASHGQAILKDMKTIILVNGSTASASEITAGALKDYGKATLIGEKTYGKGVVQTLLQLSGGSMLKVTTAHWYTPNGNTINGVGIEPDKVVEMTYEDINAGRDPQLDAALAL